MIEIDDLLEPDNAKKEVRHTVVLDSDLARMIDEARTLFGKKKVPEIIRRSIRAGLVEAFERKRSIADANKAG